MESRRRFEAPKQDAFGRELAQAPTQETSVEYAELKQKVFEVLAKLPPRERFVLAARSGIFEPFMTPDELRPHMKGQKAKFDGEGHITNPTELSVLDWYALYVTNQLSVRPEIDVEEGFTLAELGVLFGTTKGVIQQIEARGLRRLKHPSLSNKVRDYEDTQFPPGTVGLDEPGPAVRSDAQVAEDIERINDMLNPEFRKAPDDWEKASTVYDSLQRGMVFDRVFNRLLIEHPEWVRKHTDEKGRIVEYFHPKMGVELRKRLLGTSEDEEKEP